MAGVFDVLLALGILWLAWQAMHGKNLFRAVVSFMIFGLFMALAWVRLDAPDIALAEAAIGAGVTGALLLSALGRLPQRDGVVRYRRPRPPHGPIGIAAGAVLLGVLAHAVWQLPAPGLGDRVLDALPQSGVDNPVTAVLLNFRAFDTLLEIGVLLLGVVAIWALGASPWSGEAPMPSPILPTLGRTLFPLFVLVAVYLLWRGGHAAGGAFPAGAVMGAGGVLMLLAGARPWLTGSERGPWRWLLCLGLGSMLAVAVGGWLIGLAFFQYPPGLAGLLILLLELSAGLSIALLLFALYLGGQPPSHWDDEASS